MELSVLQIILAVLIVALGTAVQAAIGFGLAMVAAPLLVLINPVLVPGPLIACAFSLVSWMAWKDRAAINYTHIKAAIAGRAVGTPPAALLLGTISATTFDLIFGLLVLLAVGISLIHSNIKVTSFSIFWATAASGFMSTISAIGGPPVVLVYQNAHGPNLRANLSVLFIMGTIFSLTALVLIGRFGKQELVYGLILNVGVVTGLLCAGPFRRFVDKGTARPYLLGLCAISAIIVLGRALVDLL